MTIATEEESASSLFSENEIPFDERPHRNPDPDGAKYEEGQQDVQEQAPVLVEQPVRDLHEKSLDELLHPTARRWRNGKKSTRSKQRKDDNSYISSKTKEHQKKSKPKKAATVTEAAPSSSILRRKEENLPLTSPPPPPPPPLAPAGMNDTPNRVDDALQIVRVPVDKTTADNQRKNQPQTPNTQQPQPKQLQVQVQQQKERQTRLKVVQARGELARMIRSFGHSNTHRYPDALLDGEEGSLALTPDALVFQSCTEPSNHLCLPWEFVKDVVDRSNQSGADTDYYQELRLSLQDSEQPPLILMVPRGGDEQRTRRSSSSISSSNSSSNGNSPVYDEITKHILQKHQQRQAPKEVEKEVQVDNDNDNDEQDEERVPLATHYDTGTQQPPSPSPSSSPTAEAKPSSILLAGLYLQISKLKTRMKAMEKDNLQMELLKTRLQVTESEKTQLEQLQLRMEALEAENSQLRESMATVATVGEMTEMRESVNNWLGLPPMTKANELTQLMTTTVSDWRQAIATAGENMATATGNGLKATGNGLKQPLATIAAAGEGVVAVGAGLKLPLATIKSWDRALMEEQQEMDRKLEQLRSGNHHEDVTDYSRRRKSRISFEGDSSVEDYSRRKSRISYMGESSGEDDTALKAACCELGLVGDCEGDCGTDAEGTDAGGTVAGMDVSAAHLRMSTKKMIEHSLPPDSFSFLIASRRGMCRAPFMLAITVVIVQLGIYMLMAISMFEPDNSNQQEGSSSVIGIPINVSLEVRIGQYFAILISVLTQTDLIKGLDLVRVSRSKSFRRAYPKTPFRRIIMAGCFHAAAGAIGMTTSFFLIVTSSTVIDLLLNFTALEFVSQLDEAAFFLSSTGFAGPYCETTALLVEETKFKVSKRSLRVRKIVMLALVLALMLTSFGVIVLLQQKGVYACSTIFVQFGDDMVPALGTFSGLYDMQSAKVTVFSQYLSYSERSSSRAIFGYCQDIQAWTFRWYDIAEQAQIGASGSYDPACNWTVRSSPTETFDLTETGSLVWYVRDRYGTLREAELDPFYLACYECNNDGSDCNGRGTCTKGVCHCDKGWSGLSCEFEEACQSLFVDTVSSSIGFGRTQKFSDSYELLVVNQTQVNSYHRPVYFHETNSGTNFDALFFTGRRWAVTNMDQLFDYRPEGGHTQEALANYFNNSFHGAWSNYSVAFWSEPMDASTPDDAISPVGLPFLAATPLKPDALSFEMQGIAPSQPDTPTLLCAFCNNSTNTCLYNGQCSIHNTCQCSPGSSGLLCEIPPLGNGYCDSFFNSLAFALDGGDCCESTCSSSDTFSCGMERDGFTMKGYPSCKLPISEWQQIGQSFSGTGILSRSGDYLFVKDDLDLLVFERSGAEWVQRGQPLRFPQGHQRFYVTGDGINNQVNNRVSKPPVVVILGTDISLEPDTYLCVEECVRTELFKNAINNEISISRVDRIDFSRGASGFAMATFDNTTRTSAVRVYTSDPLLPNHIRERDYIIPAFPDFLDNGTDTELILNSFALSSTGDSLAVLATIGQDSHILVFDWNGTAYQQKRSLISPRSDSMLYGMSVSGDGDIVASLFKNSSHCEVAVLRWNSTDWTRMGSIPVYECDFHNRVLFPALSLDGRSIVFSVAENAASIYDWTDSTWEQVPNSLAVAGRLSSFSISDDGSAVFVEYSDKATGDTVSAVFATSLRHPLCPDDLSPIRLSLTLDDFPSETWWEITTVYDTQTPLDAANFTASPAEKRSTHVSELCLAVNDTCYVFSLHDTLGDGLSEPGGYTLYLNGNNITGGTLVDPLEIGETGNSTADDHLRPIWKNVYFGNCSGVDLRNCTNSGESYTCYTY